MTKPAIRYSRKENLTKDNIPTIVEPVIDTVQAIFPRWQDFQECRVWRNDKQSSVGEEKQNNESTGSLLPASASFNISSIAPNQIKLERAVVLTIVMATSTQHGTTGIMDDAEIANV